MSLFEESKNEETVNHYEALVGEGKKFTDNEALAKGKVAADQHIEKLEAEMAELRKDLDSRLTVEEALAKVHSKPEPNNSETAENTIPNKTEEVDLDKLIKQKLEEDKVQTRVAANEAECSRLMVQTYGDEDKALEAMKKVSAEQGIPLTLIKQTAQTSVTGFVKLMGIGGTPGVTTPRSSVNTEAVGVQNNGDELAELKALRKSNPREFWKPHIQNRIMQLHAVQSN